jgi:hypothetical protein
MDNRGEGERLNDVIERVVAFAIEAGIPIELSVGIDSNVFKDAIVENGGFLFLDENCNMAVNTPITFVAYDLRRMNVENNIKKQKRNKICIAFLILLLLGYIMLLAGIVVGLIIFFKDGKYPLDKFDVSYGQGLYMHVSIVPIWGILIGSVIYHKMGDLFDRIDKILDSGDSVKHMAMVANMTKSCWLRYMM